jgi:hypothetical protein
MKRLNNLVAMSGVIFGTTSKSQPPQDLSQTISLMLYTNLDYKLIQMVVKAKKIKESLLAEERLLSGH